MDERIYWFKKTGHAHWTPRSWQGWAVTAAFIALTYLGVRASVQSGFPMWFGFAWIGVCVIALVMVAIKTSAP